MDINEVVIKIVSNLLLNDLWLNILKWEWICFLTMILIKNRNKRFSRKKLSNTFMAAEVWRVKRYTNVKFSYENYVKTYVP